MAVNGITNLDNPLLNALSGLQTTQQLLSTVSRNITNDQTPGYVNKTQQAVSNAATGGSLAGPIVRYINASLQQKLRTNNADTAYQTALQTALGQINQLSGDPTQGTSIEGQLNTLQSDFQQLATNPQDSGTAEDVLNAANTLAQNFNAQTSALFGLQQTAQTNIVNDVNQVNADLQQIASLNQQVVSAQANSQDPTDLEDQRDTAVNNLSSLIGVNAFIDNQGVLQVLSSNYTPLAGMYAEHVTYNATNNAISVSGQQLTNINGDLGGNLQVLTGNTTQALQNLSEVANQVTSAFQGLPTSITGLTGTLQVPPAAAGGADIAIPGVTELVSSNGAQYSASLAYRSLGAASNAYQLVISKLVPIGNAPAVTNNGYVAATGTGGYVVGTVTFPPGALVAGTQPQSFAGQQIQLIPTVANTQPGTIGPVTAFTTGLTEAAASAPNNVTSNNTLTLFTQTNSQIPNTTIKFGGTLSAAPAFPGDTAQSAAFTITTDLGNQYTATAVYRPTSNNTGWQVVINSLVPIGSAPAVGNLNYNGAASTGGIVIGGFDPSTSPPTFLSTDQIAGIPTSSSAPSQFPGHIEPIEFDSTSTIAIGAVAAPVVSAVTQNVTAPYYSGDIEVNPNISLRALQVGDQFAGTAADTNGGAAAAAASALVNNQFTFTTAGIAGTQTLEVGAGQSTINVGQDLTNANNQITTLNTANTQITQAIAPQSEVNLDTQMSQLVVLQNLYQANARVVTTANQLLDTLINLVQ